MPAKVLCRFGLHRWKRVWRDGDSYRECARCGKLHMTYDIPGSVQPVAEEFFRSGMAPDRESDDRRSLAARLQVRVTFPNARAGSRAIVSRGEERCPTHHRPRSTTSHPTIASIHGARGGSGFF